MEAFNRKKHWEKIYETKALNEVSWFQPTPSTSLEIINSLNVPKDARIIDVGGGDSFLVDCLLDLGYANITVLDISETAIARAKERLGKRAESVRWIVADVAEFEPSEQYDLWHDRAAFHFLTKADEVAHYIQSAEKGLGLDGKIVLGTFSNTGPLKCSGIEVQQYSDSSISEILKPTFEKIECFTIDHKTPFDTQQNFLFCCFRKL